jgi:hypothetical protein
MLNVLVPSPIDFQTDTFHTYTNPSDNSHLKRVPSPNYPNPTLQSVKPPLYGISSRDVIDEMSATPPERRPTKEEILSDIGMGLVSTFSLVHLQMAVERTMASTRTRRPAEMALEGMMI